MPQLTELKPVSIAAQLRQRWPQIERLIADGVPQQLIVASLCDEGVVITYQTFRDYLCRERKRRKTQTAGSYLAPRLSILPPGTGGATPPQKFAGLNISNTDAPENATPLTRKQRRDAYAAQFIHPEQSHPLLQRRKESES